MGGDSTSTVLWDLDDTICRQPASTDDLLAEAFESAGVEPFFSAAEFEAWIPRVVGDNQLDLREKCFSAIANEKGRDLDRARAVAHAFEDPDPSDVRFVPGARTALESLSEDYRMGLVTNGARETQQRKLGALEIEEYFDAAVFATPEEALKPDPDPFHWALEEMGVPANRAVHVGDSLESDVKGAEAAGVRSVWLAEDGVDETPTTEPSYVIRSLAELRPPPWDA